MRLNRLESAQQCAGNCDWAAGFEDKIVIEKKLDGKILKYKDQSDRDDKRFSRGVSFRSNSGDGTEDLPSIGDFEVKIRPEKEMIDIGGSAEELNKNCLNALAIADKNYSAVQLARDNWAFLQAAAAKTSIDPAILAAIGVRESGFRNVKQPNGGGRGIFQIDTTQQRLSDEEKKELEKLAMDSDVGTQALLAATFLDNFYTDHVYAMTHNGYSVTEGQNARLNHIKAIGASVHAYNSGKLYTVKIVDSKTGEIEITLKSQFKAFLQPTGKISDLDKGTVGNYVSNVWDIAIDCFGMGMR